MAFFCGYSIACDGHHIVGTNTYLACFKIIYQQMCPPTWYQANTKDTEIMDCWNESISYNPQSNWHDQWVANYFVQGLGEGTNPWKSTSYLDCYNLGKNTTNLAMIKGIINAVCSPGKAQGTTSKEVPKHPKTPELEKLLTVGNADIQ